MSRSGGRVKTWRPSSGVDTVRGRRRAGRTVRERTCVATGRDRDRTRWSRQGDERPHPPQPVARGRSREQAPRTHRSRPGGRDSARLPCHDTMARVRWRGRRASVRADARGMRARPNGVTECPDRLGRAWRLTALATVSSRSPAVRRRVIDCLVSTSAVRRRVTGCLVPTTDGSSTDHRTASRSPSDRFVFDWTPPTRCRRVSRSICGS